jgi:hypothetical protein
MDFGAEAKVGLGAEVDEVGLFLEAAEVGLGVAVLDVRWCLFCWVKTPRFRGGPKSGSREGKRNMDTSSSLRRKMCNKLILT